ncbi:MAG: hypothetical protein IJ561_05290, partial [Ruminococcus sp.]|nr:hypothetical protein [Ruminococcus sp.]
EKGDENNDGKIIDGDKEYKVITSEFKFTIDEDGKVTVTESTSNKTEKDENNEDGYYLYDDKTEGKLTVKVCDAEVEEENPGDDNPGDDNPGDDNPGSEDDNKGTDGEDDKPGENNPGGNEDDRKSGGSDDEEKPGNDDKKSGGSDDEGTPSDDDKKSGGEDDAPKTGAGAGFTSFLLIGAAAIVLTKKKKG